MKTVLGLIAASALAASPVHALCIYNGVDNATTKIPQEFRDSKWVVRAKLVSARDHWSDVLDSWTIYAIDIKNIIRVRQQDGHSSLPVPDSGGFYMDQPWVPLPRGHDMGGEYFLFLDPFPWVKGEPKEAKHSVHELFLRCLRILVACARVIAKPARPSSAQRQNKPRALRLATPSRPTTMWSWTVMPMTLPASAT